MEKTLASIQPRYLRYRSHYKIYLIFLLTLSGLILCFWGHQLSQNNWSAVYEDLNYEIWMSACYFLVFGSFYFFWLKDRLNHAVQVFEEYVLIHDGKLVEKVEFSEIESVSMVCWSLFYFKMKNGHKYYFSSSLERVDYIWEGMKSARPELVPSEEFESFRLKLVQYDHHQKRKEWFFRHRLVDIVNWTVLPGAFLLLSYFIQSREVHINQQGLYFFRLFMYAVLIMLVTTFLFSIVLKRFIFDRKIELQMEESGDKLRDIEFEGIILQRSKVFQMITASLVFALVVRMDVNLFSLSKPKSDLSYFNLKKGQTLVIDNRYNCVACKYHLNDGDLVIFGKGHVGQVLAKEGEAVGQISQDHQGRTIASEQIQTVPYGHIALKLPNGKDIVMIRVNDLIGKIQR